jgi:glycosyltransferase 2 family protein
LTPFRSVLGTPWFKLALSVVLLVVLFVRTEFGQIWGTIARSEPGWLLLALVGLEISQVLSAARWWLLARPLGFNEPFRRYLVYYFSGMYLNLFAPSTVAGDIGRAFFLAGGRQRRALALTSVIADRGLGFVALVWVGAGAVILLPGYPVPRILHLAAWFVPPLTVAAWVWGPLLVVRLLPPGNRWRILVESDLAPYRKDHRLMTGSFALAVLFHLIQIGTQILIAWSLDLTIPWSYFLVFVPVVNIAGMLPITMNGVGVRESGYWYFLSRIGTDSEAAIALGLLSSAITLATGLSGAPVFLFFQPRKPHVASGGSSVNSGKEEQMSRKREDPS